MSGVRQRMTGHLTPERLRLEVARATRPFAVVVLALAIGLASIVALLLRLGVALPGEERYEVRVAVDDAKGVVAGSNEVRIAGVVVGKIVGVALGGGRAVLTAQIEQRHAPLYRDARLRLRPKTPLEDMYLNVEDRGTPRAGTVDDGEQVSAARTRVPVHVGEVLNVFNADARPRVAQAIAALGHGLGDHGDDFRAALGEMAPFLDAARRLTHESAVRARVTRRLITNFTALSGEVADRDGDVRRLVRSGDGVLGELARSDRPLGALIQQLPPTLRRIPSSFAALRAAADDLDGALVALRPTARALPRGLRAVRALSPDLRRAASSLRKPLPSLARLARALPGLTRDLGAGFATLRPQAPRLDRVTRAVVPCRLAVAKFFQWTLSVGKFYGPHGAVLRGDTIVSPATANGLASAAQTSTPDCAAGAPRK